MDSIINKALVWVIFKILLGYQMQTDILEDVLKTGED